MLENFEDYYSILQVHPDAEPEIIQSAYKRLIKKYHPDVNAAPGATAQMGRINLAYETLSDARARRVYHLEWQRRAGSSAPRAAAPPRVEVRERVVYKDPPPPPPPPGTPQARETVLDYFRCIARRDFKAAFALVSDADKTRFTYEEFLEWQGSVAELYEIGSFEAKWFKKVPGDRQAEEYSVSLREKDRASGQVRQYATTKQAVLENGTWRVYLGYENLTPLLVQFKTQASSNLEARLTGLWEKYREEHDEETGVLNRRGFESALAPEVYRHQRYGRPFSLAVFEVSVPRWVRESGHLERIIKYAAYIIGRTVRVIDNVAFLGGGRFAVLLAETDKAVAGQAARRILRAVRHDVAACFDFEVDVYAGLTEYGGQPLDALIDGCMRTIASAKTAQVAR